MISRIKKLKVEAVGEVLRSADRVPTTGTCRIDSIVSLLLLVISDDHIDTDKWVKP